jgi:hypothetical protein
MEFLLDCPKLVVNRDGFHTNANSPCLIEAPKTNGDYFYTEYKICTTHMYKEQNKVSHSQIYDGSKLLGLISHQLGPTT